MRVTADRAARESILRFACEYVGLALEGYHPQVRTPKENLAMILRAALVACSESGYRERERAEAINLLCRYGFRRADREDACS